MSSVNAEKNRSRARRQSTRNSRTSTNLENYSYRSRSRSRNEATNSQFEQNHEADIQQGDTQNRDGETLGEQVKALLNDNQAKVFELIVKTMDKDRLKNQTEIKNLSEQYQTEIKNLSDKILELENKISVSERKCDGCDEKHEDVRVKLYSPQCIRKRAKDSFIQSIDKEFPITPPRTPTSNESAAE